MLGRLKYGLQKPLEPAGLNFAARWVHLGSTMGEIIPGMGVQRMSGRRHRREPRCQMSKRTMALSSGSGRNPRS